MEQVRQQVQERMHHTLKETLATRDSRKELQQRDIGHVMCYQCKNTGQYANDCPEKKDAAKLTIHPYTSKVTTRCCYSCKEEGHYSRDCPIKRTRSEAFAIEYDRKEIEALLALEESKKKRKLGSNQHHSEPRRDISQVLCFKCNEIGHYADNCPEKMARKAAKAIVLDKGSENQIKMGENSSHNLHVKPSKKDLSLVQCFTCMKWDTIHGTVQKR